LLLFLPGAVLYGILEDLGLGRELVCVGIRIC